MSKKILIGNWKMNINCINNGINLIDNIMKSVNKNILIDNDIVIAAPFVYLPILINKFKKFNIKFAAQNCFYKEYGSYTGEISVGMLKSINTDYVIIGHSERRMIFNERNDIILKKIHLLFKYKLIPILCIGEPYINRQNNTYYEYIEKQIVELLIQIDKFFLSKIIIAYEPIWAIGSNNSASIKEIQLIYNFIKKILYKYFDKNIVDNVAIIYGGSCNHKNSHNILNNLNGIILGKSSLDLIEFVKIMQCL